MVNRICNNSKICRACNSHMQASIVQFDILESTLIFHASSKVYNYDKYSK